MPPNTSEIEKTKTEQVETAPTKKMVADLELVSNDKCHGGSQRVYRHWSEETQSYMRFSIFLPYWSEKEKIEGKKYPVLFFLSGVCCNDQNFLYKTSFQKYAKENNMIVVGSDTSPRTCILNQKFLIYLYEWIWIYNYIFAHSLNFLQENAISLMKMTFGYLDALPGGIWTLQLSPIQNIIACILM